MGNWYVDFTNNDASKFYRSRFQWRLYSKRLHHYPILHRVKDKQRVAKQKLVRQWWTRSSTWPITTVWFSVLIFKRCRDHGSIFKRLEEMLEFVCVPEFVRVCFLFYTRKSHFPLDPMAIKHIHLIIIVHSHSGADTRYFYSFSKQLTISHLL